MKSTSFHSLFLLLLIVVVAIAEQAVHSADVACTFTLNVKTRNVNNAGTDSRISVVLGDESNHTWMIPDLASNGVMPRGHDYFERGNLDFFVVKGTCMPSPVCRIIVTSDYTGNKPGWFVEYINVIKTEPNKPRTRNSFFFETVTRNSFWINQWLASDTAPFQLSTRHENCGVGTECVYMFKVQTGTVKNAGTDSRINITLANASGTSILIPNLAGSGVMQSGHDYFENGNLDLFVFSGPCIPSMCRLTVSSDGTGNDKPGWYLGYVDITTTGPNIPRTLYSFQVNQWLANDSAPYQLSTTRDKCGAR